MYIDIKKKIPKPQLNDYSDWEQRWHLVPNQHCKKLFGKV